MNYYTIGTNGNLINQPQTATIPNVNSLPQAMDVGQTYSFVYEWRTIPTFGNVITLDDGTKVVKDSTNKNLLKVKQITTDAGASLYVVDSVYKVGVQCLENNECTNTYGKGYYCDSTNTFTCTKKANFCSTDFDCGSGQPQWTLIGGQVHRTMNTCNISTNTCQQSDTIKACNPNVSYPNNVCPVDKPYCDPSGDMCYALQKQKVVCTSDCCLDNGPDYYAKDCPTGLVCTPTTSGSYVGSCKTISKQCTAPQYYDAITNSCLNCPSNTAFDSTTNTCIPKDVCAGKVGYHTETSIQGGFFGLGAQEVTQCKPDVDWGFIVIIGIIVVVTGAIIYLKFIRKKKRK